MIDDMNYKDALQRQLTIANMLAPNGNAQQRIVRMVSEMERNGESYSDILVQVILWIALCLRNQNWPE